jgi:DNA-binding transcriptional LysR family regulator
MDIRDLQVFLAVTTRLNFTRAGEDVHLSQPSVSVRIRQLERELGVKLFEQLGKRVALTGAGRLLEPYARRVVAAMDDARHAVEELQGLERGTVRVGASTTPGTYLVPGIIARFKRDHPKVEIRLSVKDTRRVEEGVLENDFDFGFVGGHLVSREVEVIPWITDEILLVVAPKHSLAKRRQVRIRDLKGEKFIFREPGSATQAAVSAALHDVGIEVESVMEADNPGVAKQAVQSGLGIAFLSHFAIRTEVRAKTLRAVNVQGLDIRRELKIVHRKDKHLSRAALALIETAHSG